MFKVVARRSSCEETRRVRKIVEAIEGHTKSDQVDTFRVEQASPGVEGPARDKWFRSTVDRRRRSGEHDGYCEETRAASKCQNFTELGTELWEAMLCG